MADKVMILHYKTKTQCSNTKKKKVWAIVDLQWNLINPYLANPLELNSDSE